MLIPFAVLAVLDTKLMTVNVHWFAWLELRSLLWNHLLVLDNGN